MDNEGSSSSGAEAPRGDEQSLQTSSSSTSVVCQSNENTDNASPLDNSQHSMQAKDGSPITSLTVNEPESISSDAEGNVTEGKSDNVPLAQTVDEPKDIIGNANGNVANQNSDDLPITSHDMDKPKNILGNANDIEVDQSSDNPLIIQTNNEPKNILGETIGSDGDQSFANSPMTSQAMNESNDIPSNGNSDNESSDESDESVCSVIEAPPYTSPKSLSLSGTCDDHSGTLKRTTSKDNLQALGGEENQSYEPMYAFMGNVNETETGQDYENPPPNYEMDDQDDMNGPFQLVRSSQVQSRPIGPMCNGNVFFSRMNHALSNAREMMLASMPSTSYASFEESDQYPLRPYDVNIIPHSFETDAPFITLTSKENSCPFMERRVSLYKPIKVGRAIAKTRPSGDNAIFDCKVLSRNHALIWFQDGRFYLKDTQSSNGTFINSVRLSTANEKSQPYELFSRDTVQFGVEVTEKKNVHSCVIACIRLYFPDGVEASRKPIESNLEGLSKSSILGTNMINSNTIITPGQMIELSFYVNDALNKQALLESQLAQMKQMLRTTIDMAKNNWAAMMEEDRLLSRIQSLQSQIETLLVVNSTEGNEEGKLALIKEEILNLISDKEKFENYSKATLQKALDDKLTAVTNLQAIEIELSLKEEACEKLNSTLKKNVKEMKTLSSYCDEIKQERDELQVKIKQVEEEFCKQFATVEQERNVLQELVSNLQKSESDLQTQINELKEANNNCPETSNLESQINSSDLICVKEAKSLTNGVTHSENGHLHQLDSSPESQMKAMFVRVVEFERAFNELNNQFNMFNTMIKSMGYQLVTFRVKIEEIQEKLLARRRAEREQMMALIERESELEITNRGLNLSIQIYEEMLEKKDKEIEALTKRLDECDVGSENKIEQAIQTVGERDYSLKTNAAFKAILTAMDRFDNGINIDRDNLVSSSSLDMTEKLVLRLNHLADKYKKSQEANLLLSEELSETQDQYASLSYQNDLSFFVAVCPLVIILFAIITAFYPILSMLMGTTGV